MGIIFIKRRYILFLVPLISKNISIDLCNHLHFHQLNRRLDTYKLKNPTSPNNKRIVDSCRPVTIINHAYYLEDCDRYSIGGSGFIIKYVDDYLFLTARHVLYGKYDTHSFYEDRNQFEHFVIRNLREMKDLGNNEERIEVISTYVPPVNLELSNTLENDKSVFTQSLFSMEAQDIAICVLGASYDGDAIEWNHQPGVLKDKDDLGRLSIQDELIVVGYPKKLNRVTPNEKENNSNMEIDSCHIKGYCSEILEGHVEAIMTVTNHCNGMIYLDGISGSPVFNISQQTGEYKFVGMVLQADTTRGKVIRFIMVNHLSIHLMMTDIKFPFSMLKNKNFQEMTQKKVDSLIGTLGAENVKIEGDILEVTTYANDKFTFNRVHEIYYTIIYLLHGTSLFSSKNIYLLGNVYSRIKKWEEFHEMLINEKNKLTQEHIETINTAFLDMDSYNDAALSVEILQQKLFT